MRLTCWPFGVLKTTVACEIPEASEGLMSTTFHVRSAFQPNIFFKNALKVASEGCEPFVAVAAGEALFTGALLEEGLAFCAAEYAPTTMRQIRIEQMRRFMSPF